MQNSDQRFITQMYQQPIPGNKLSGDIDPSHNPSNDPDSGIKKQREALLNEVADICFGWPEHEVVTFLFKVQERLQGLLLARLDEASYRNNYMLEVVENLRNILPVSDETTSPIQ